MSKTKPPSKAAISSAVPVTTGCAIDDPAHSPPAVQSISLAIATVRGQRVILDSDLAALYDVPTKRFNEQVRRNLGRFPADFMFQLKAEEHAALRSQIATSNTRGGRRYLPLAFTEHGAIMAAMVLNSPRAVEVSVYVVRAFTRLREAAITHRDLATRLTELEEKTDLLATQHDTFSRNTRNQLRQVFDALRELALPTEAPRRPIGFVSPSEKKGTKDARGEKAV